MDAVIAGLQQGLIWCLLVLGIYISYRILDCADLGVEGTFPLGASIAGVFIHAGMPPVCSLLFAAAGGFIGGMITGFIHTKLKIPMILAGIITMTAMLSVNLTILGLTNKEVSSLASLSIQNSVYKKFTDILTSHSIKPIIADKISVILITLLICFISCGAVYYLFGTELGMAVRATGNNEHMAKALGINTSAMIVVGLAVSNGLVAVSGALFAQNVGTVNVNIGRGAIVNGLASIIIGEIIFGRKTFKKAIVSCVTGSAIFFFLRALAIKAGVDHYLDLMTALMITVILALPVLKKRKSGKVKAC